MPAMKRVKTNYVGVYYVIGTTIASKKPEKIFYIMYRRDGKLIEEKVGRQIENKMTAAKASIIRASRIEGKSLSNKAKREEKANAKAVKPWTVSRLWESYVENNPIKGMVTDANRFDLHIEPVMGNKEPLSISPFDLDKLRLTMGKDHKPATVRNTLELLRRIINYGVKSRVISPLPFKIKLPTVNNLKTEDLTTEQLQALLKAIDEDIHPLAGPMMLMALFTGMRRGELFSLRWCDVDFDRGFISIVDPKGGQDQKIPLNKAAREVLEGMPKDSEYVFPGRGGDRRVDIHKAVNAIKQKAGLPEDFRSLHGLRHAYASMLASSGKVDMYVLQRLMTHKSPMMTQRYSHLRDETLKRASEVAGELVAEALHQAGEVGEQDGNVISIRK